MGCNNHETHSITQEEAIHYVVVLCRQYQKEMSCFRSVVPVNHIFSNRLNRWPSGNPSSSKENTTLEAALSADRQTKYID